MIRARAVVISSVLALLGAVCPALGDSSPPGEPRPGPAPPTSDKIAQLLQRVHMTMEPGRRQVQELVDLIDAELDRRPAEARIWVQLGDALAFRGAPARHAASPRDAWRKAYELAPDDCHIGALLARGELGAGPSPTLEALQKRDRPCAEVSYLASRKAAAGERIALLERSRATAPSGDALVELGTAYLARGRLADARAAYRAALAAPPLFPEDYRPDGRAAVRSHLGLCMIAYRQKRLADARKSWTEFESWYLEPGPWHDLSDEEEAWRKTLARKLRRR